MTKNEPEGAAASLTRQTANNTMRWLHRLPVIVVVMSLPVLFSNQFAHRLLQNWRYGL